MPIMGNNFVILQRVSQQVLRNLIQSIIKLKVWNHFIG
jgi:hypothetical protein